MSLDRAIHEAKEVKREHAKKASRAVIQALDKHNDSIKKKREQRYESEIHEITRYHEDRVMKNRTYH